MLRLIASLCLFSICFAGNSRIIRPCRLSDYQCIADNLAANSECNAKGSGIVVPNKYLIPKYKYSTPIFNSSYIETNLLITNMDKCYISEFFINKATNVIVLSMDCPDINFDTDRELIQHRSLEESRKYRYHINSTYPLVRMTVNLTPKLKYNICVSDIYTELVGDPIMHVQPKDQKTANFLSTDLTMLRMYEEENFFVRGRYIMRDNVNVICDYRCPYVYTDNWF